MNDVVAPVGWGFAPKRRLVYDRPGITRDWSRIARAVRALVASGYATAAGTRRQKIRDIRDRFGVAHNVAADILRVATGGKKRTRYPQGFRLPGGGERA